MLIVNLQSFATFLTSSLLDIARPSRLGDAVQFFVYDTPKVLLLLTLIVFVVGVIRSFTQERTSKHLAGKRETVDNVMAALLGIVTPSQGAQTQVDPGICFGGGQRYRWYRLPV